MDHNIKLFLDINLPLNDVLQLENLIYLINTHIDEGISHECIEKLYQIATKLIMFINNKIIVGQSFDLLINIFYFLNNDQII